jgi:hypothetical protein
MIDFGTGDAAKLRAALYELWTEHRDTGMLPTSGRFLFYELVANETISKKRTGAHRADQNMTEALMWLREKKLIPWDDIVDETRSLENYEGYPTIRDGVISVLEQVRLDAWDGFAPMILTESRSVAGALRPLAQEYGVLIAATNGQCGGFLHTEIAPSLRAGSENRRVLYLGDLDKQGNDIEANTRRVLEEIVGPLEWERLALTAAQAEEYNLTVIQKYDARTKSSHDAIETEALSQSVIVSIVRARLDALIPEPIETVQVREARAQRRFRRQILRVKRFNQ